MTFKITKAKAKLILDKLSGKDPEIQKALDEFHKDIDEMLELVEEKNLILKIEVPYTGLDRRKSDPISGDSI